ncbi:hypothetical protein AURDEDRAFT_175096 [Auricularia subglabra TFB-10046 SS5]|uniref:Uncharacterized protein n=1 Tax=Auricularia subglabra (strain TFB-10046 / SS5) TaxID=717982 RepID=J0LF77_AURST|nr:hypothetical protein AURDEDRAFT_175096 [Auricularia subglabra TFB-10046 SS5]
MSKRPESESRSPDQNPSKRRATESQSTALPAQPVQDSTGGARGLRPSHVQDPAARQLGPSVISAPRLESPETSSAGGPPEAAPDPLIHDLLSKKDVITPKVANGTRAKDYAKYATQLAMRTSIWRPENPAHDPFDRLVDLLRDILRDMPTRTYFQPPPVLTSLDDHQIRTVLSLNTAFASAVADALRNILEESEDLHPTLVALIAYLCYEPEPTSDGASVPAKEENDIAEVLEAWRAPLRGCWHLSLLAALREAHLENAHHGPNEHYSNNVTMLQSSGTGKTRNADEMSKFILLILLILREARDTTGYPKADASVRDFLVVLPGAKVSEEEYRAKVRRFLLVLILSIRAWLCHQGPAPPPPPGEDIARTYWKYLFMVNSWRLFVARERINLYDAVVAAAEMSAPVDATALATALANLIFTLKGIAVNTADDDTLVPSIFKTNKMLANELRDVFDAALAASNAAKASPLRVPDLSAASPELLVLLSFDEAQGLTASALQPLTTGSSVPPHSDPVVSPLRPKSAYDIILSVLDDMRTQVAGLFLSTSTKIGQFAPPAALAPSARQVDSKRLQAPITELPFDCFLDRPLKVGSPELALDNLSSVSFMAKFGRALTGSRLANADSLPAEQKRAREDSLMELIRGKLSGGRELDEITSNLHKRLIAGADARMCVQFERRKSSILGSTEADLVASHLRLAISVPSHRLYFHSGYSSEPIVAEAAAMLMRTWMARTTPWHPVNTLVELMQQGKIDPGEQGELTARLLLTLAYDRAMHKANEGQPAIWLFSKGCKFLLFIDALFGEKNAASLRSSPPDNIPDGDPLSTAFANSLVRFTHFVRLGDGSGLTTTALCAAFIRGMAFIGCVNQKKVDLIIPVLVNDQLATPVCPGNMTAILIQVKRRLKPGAANKYDYTAESLGVFRDSDNDDRHNKFVSRTDRRTRPYCMLLMELATYQPVKDKKAKAAQAAQAPPVTPRKQHQTAPPAAPTPSGLTLKEPAPRTSPREKNPNEPHPRYNIKAYGCSNTVYGVIDPDNDGPGGKAKYSQLLGTRDFEDEHPRPQLLPLVRQMKPEWIRDGETNSYEWFDAEIPIESPHFEDESQDGVHASAYGQNE